MSDATPPLVQRERVALALLAVGTVVLLPGALDRFVFLKVTIMTFGTAIAFSCPARGRLPRKVSVIVCIGALILLIATLREPAPFAALVGRAPRYEGIFILLVYLGAAAAGARLLGPDRAPGSTQWFLRWLTVAAVLVGLEAVLELSGLRPLATNVTRPGSLLGNASDEGAWAVLVLGPLTAVAATTRRWEYVLGAVAAGVTLVASGSRGALVGGLVVFAVLLVLDRRRVVTVVVLTGVVALAIGVLAAPTTRSRVIGTSPYSLETVEGRALLWSETFTLIGDHPVLGVGASGFVNAIPKYHTQQWQRKIGSSNPPDSPHDWILQAASDGGILLALDALALATIVLLAGIAASRRQPTRGERAAVIGMVAGVAGYGVALMFHLTSPTTTPLAAVMAGALLATNPTPGDEKPINRSTRNLLIATFAALSLLLLCAAVAEVPLRSAIIDAASGRLATADHDFHVAADFRPWDSSIDATAAHAYAVLASHGEPGAATRGSPWAKRALNDDPDGVGSLQDAATIDAALGRESAAHRSLERAMALDPTDPQVLLALARVDTTQGRRQAATRILEEAHRLVPRNVAVRRELNVLRQ
jgi:O-antigen ligase